MPLGWWKDMIYLVEGYDLPGGRIWSTYFLHCRNKHFWPKLDRSYPSTIPRAKKRKTSKNKGKNMVEGYALPTPPILQKEAFLAKKGGRIWSTCFWPTKRPGRSYNPTLEGGRIWSTCPFFWAFFWGGPFGPTKVVFFYLVVLVVVVVGFVAVVVVLLLFLFLIVVLLLICCWFVVVVLWLLF